MQDVDPAAADVFFDEFGTVLENQSARDRVSSVFRVPGPCSLAAEFIRPRVFTFVSVTGVVNAEPVVRYVFEKKLSPMSKPTPRP